MSFAGEKRDSSYATSQASFGAKRKNASDDSNYERKNSSSGKFHFNLKAGNGQVIGSSEMYESAAGMENGIESVKKNAPVATVEEEKE